MHIKGPPFLLHFISHYITFQNVRLLEAKIFSYLILLIAFFVSIFGLLQTMWQWTFMYQSLGIWMFSFILNRYLEVELLVDIVNLFIILRNCQAVFQSGKAVLNTRRQWITVLVSSHTCLHLLLSYFFKIDFIYFLDL